MDPDNGKYQGSIVPEFIDKDERLIPGYYAVVIKIAFFWLHVVFAPIFAPLPYLITIWKAGLDFHKQANIEYFSTLQQITRPNDHSSYIVTHVASVAQTASTTETWEDWKIGDARIVCEGILTWIWNGTMFVKPYRLSFLSSHSLLHHCHFFLSTRFSFVEVVIEYLWTNQLQIMPTNVNQVKPPRPSEIRSPGLSSRN